MVNLNLNTRTRNSRNNKVEKWRHSCRCFVDLRSEGRDDVHRSLKHPSAIQIGPYVTYKGYPSIPSPQFRCWRTNPVIAGQKSVCVNGPDQCEWIPECITARLKALISFIYNTMLAEGVMTTNLSLSRCFPKNKKTRVQWSHFIHRRRVYSIDFGRFRRIVGSRMM